MTKEEALKKWREEVVDWKKASGFNPDEQVTYDIMNGLIEILDAIIDPKEEEPEEYPLDPNGNAFKLKQQFDAIAKDKDAWKSQAFWELKQKYHEAAIKESGLNMINIIKERYSSNPERILIGKIKNKLYKVQNSNIEPKGEPKAKGNLDVNLIPPPWHIGEHPEKTEGWIEFQKAARKDPAYYGDILQKLIPKWVSFDEEKPDELYAIFKNLRRQEDAD